MSEQEHVTGNSQHIHQHTHTHQHHHHHYYSLTVSERVFRSSSSSSSSSPATPTSTTNTMARAGSAQAEETVANRNCVNSNSIVDDEDGQILFDSGYQDDSDGGSDLRGSGHDQESWDSHQSQQTNAMLNDDDNNSNDVFYSNQQHCHQQQEYFNLHGDPVKTPLSFSFSDNDTNNQQRNDTGEFNGIIEEEQEGEYAGNFNPFLVPVVSPSTSNMDATSVLYPHSEPDDYVNNNPINNNNNNGDNLDHVDYSSSSSTVAPSPSHTATSNVTASSSSVDFEYRNDPIPSCSSFSSSSTLSFTDIHFGSPLMNDNGVNSVNSVNGEGEEVIDLMSMSETDANDGTDTNDCINVSWSQQNHQQNQKRKRNTTPPSLPDLNQFKRRSRHTQSGSTSDCVFNDGHFESDDRHQQLNDDSDDNCDGASEFEQQSYLQQNTTVQYDQQQQDDESINNQDNLYNCNNNNRQQQPILEPSQQIVDPSSTSKIASSAFHHSEYVRILQESQTLASMLTDLRYENESLKVQLAFPTSSSGGGGNQEGNVDEDPMAFIRVQAGESVGELTEAVKTIRAGLEKGFQEVLDGMRALKRVEDRLESLGSVLGI
ncbi:UNVERIFIED_CONTAM: hypothetical protein HDU68_008002 [Siphonaria sp. JEL0065]|nr:hypothetical protein HDU68_008002 [Siphonaria sp. JEL0065]